MKKIIKYLWVFLNSKIFFIILAVILGFFFMRSCNNSNEEQRKREIAEQNILAKDDTISIIKLENGELEASKAGFILSEKELLNQDSILNSKLKGSEGKLLSANRAVFRLEQDNAYLASRVADLEKHIDEKQIDDSTWIMEWSLKYMYDSLN